MNEREIKKRSFGPTFDEIRDLHLELVVIQSRRLPMDLSLSYSIRQKRLLCRFFLKLSDSGDA